jgi:hypothetical protein
MATRTAPTEENTLLADEMRTTLFEHSESIAQLRADVGTLHRDNSEVKSSLSEIKQTLQVILAKEDAAKPGPGLATILGMAVSTFILLAFLIGGLKYFINAEVLSSKMLLEYRVSRIEAAVSWMPSLVSISGTSPSSQSR